MADKAFFYQAETSPPEETLPTPPTPEHSWYVPDARIPRRKKHVPRQPLALLLLEELFEDPPPAPELSWQHDEAIYPPPPPPRFAQDQSQIEENLYGTIDLHPGYWQDTNLPIPPKPKALAKPESQSILLEELFTEQVYGWEYQDPQPPKRGKFWDWVAIATVDAVAEFPHYVRLYADSLRYYLTGAASDGGDQPDQAASLGGYRSNTEAQHGSHILLAAIPGLSIDYASRANGDDGRAGSLVATSADSVAYAAPDGLMGPRVELTAGETYTVFDGADPSRFVRVTRTSPADLLGVASLEFTDQYGNVVSMSDAANSEATAGGNRYRAIMLRNASYAVIKNVRIWIQPLATPCNGGSLPSSGAGTISGSFCEWPHQGWCRIVDSEGTLREIVYYSTRTATHLTVPALGRGRLGTSAAAGQASDRLYPVPPIRLAWELASPPVGGAVQTIADETTAPTGLAWSTAISAASGITITQLDSAQQGALWIHRELPAGVSPYSEHQTQIRVRFSAEGETYTETLGGLWRIAVTAARKLLLHVGFNELPDLDADPDDTLTVPPGASPEEHLAANPWTTSAELDQGDGTYNVAVNFQNEYGLRSEQLLTTTITLANGEASANPPSPPVIQTMEAAAAGAFRVTAVYYWLQDTAEQRADQFLVYLSTDGSDPDPDNDSPTVVNATLAGDGLAILDWTSTAFAGGTVGKVLVRMRRSGDGADSESSDILSAIAVASAPSAISGGLFYRKQAEG